MTTYTADDFEHAHFAMHPATGSVACKGRMDWKWVLPGWYDTGDVSRLSDQQMADAGWAPARMPAGSYTRTAEKAEKERDEARDGLTRLARALDVPDTATTGDMIARIEEINAKLRPLTLEVTGEMIERAQKRAEEFYSTESASRSALFSILTAALTEPPARPEGAEELGELIGTWTATEDIAPAQLPTGSLATLADFLAERGVRVVGEEQP